MSDLATTLELINYAFVLFFGVVVSLYLADINFMDYKSLYIFTLLGFGAAQGIFYLLMGESLLYRCYPLLIHLPLFLLIWLVFHRNFYVAAIAVLSAYLLCTPRKWVGTLVTSFFRGNSLIANTTAICVTIPLLFLIVRYVAPYIIRLNMKARKLFCSFSCCRLHTTYSNILSRSTPICCTQEVLLSLISWTVSLFCFSLFYLCCHLIFPIRKTKQNGKTCFSPLLPHRRRKKLSSYLFPRSRLPSIVMTFVII